MIILLFANIGLAAATENEETKCCCTTHDTSACLGKVNEKVDAQLNATYQKAIIAAQKFGDDDIENLRDAERKWLGYRDAECKAEYGMWGGGSGGPNARSICIIRLTRQRTAELESRYHVH